MNNRWLTERCSAARALDDQAGFQNKLLLGDVPWKVAAAKIRCDRLRVQGTDEIH